MLNIPYYELDNMVWHRTNDGDIRNSTGVRDAILNDTIASNKWIIEGVHYTWTQQCFEHADLIIYLDTPIWKRNYRILKRFLVQKLGFEQGNYKQTFSMLWRMYKWNYDHNKKDKQQIFKIIEPYSNKLLVLNDNINLDKHFIID